MDDYYSLLGVKRSADTEEIRAAYRQRKEAAGDGSSKADAAALNKAWNVLSDPYQRGRYDATLEAGPERVEGDDIEVVDDAATAPPPRRGFFQPREGAPPRPIPQIDLPEGYAFPPQRRRIVAMVIDLSVLLIVFIGSQFAAVAYRESTHEATIDQIDALTEQIDDLNEQKDELEDRENPPEDQIDELDEQINDLEDERSELNDTTVASFTVANAASFGFGLLYLIIPSALTGRTLGKRLQHVKVIRVDGRPIGWAGAMQRYGLLVAGTYALSIVMGPLAAAIALFVVMGWMRHPNQQSLLDRSAKTIVVTESSNA